MVYSTPATIKTDSGDFGWFEDVVQDDDAVAVYSRAQRTSDGMMSDDETSCDSDSSSSSIQRCSSHFRLKRNKRVCSSINPASTSLDVLFVFSNLYSSSSCRAFDKLVQVSLPSFRIVQDKVGIHAEFKIVITVEAESIVAWKRYSDFTHLATKVGIAASFLDFFSAAPAHKSLSASQKSWLELESKKPWFRNVSVKYLAWKCTKLEEFLRNFLFESSSPEQLLLFAQSLSSLSRDRQYDL